VLHDGLTCFSLDLVLLCGEYVINAPFRLSYTPATPVSRVRGVPTQIYGQTETLLRSARDPHRLAAIDKWLAACVNRGQRCLVLTRFRTECEQIQENALQRDSTTSIVSWHPQQNQFPDARVICVTRQSFCLGISLVATRFDTVLFTLSVVSDGMLARLPKLLFRKPLFVVCDSTCDWDRRSCDTLCEFVRKHT
jgi:hypothetical protein